MIKLTDNMQDFIIQNKINKLILNRNNKDYISSRLVSLKDLKDNWLYPTEFCWVNNIVIFHTIRTSYPFKVGDVTVNEEGNDYSFNCVGFMNLSPPFPKITPHLYRRWGLLNEVRYTITNPNYEFITVTDVRLLELSRVKDAFEKLLIKPRRLEEFYLADQNKSEITLPIQDINFDYRTLLTADYRTDGGFGLISDNNKVKIGWSLYKL